MVGLFSEQYAKKRCDMLQVPCKLFKDKKKCVLTI